MSERHRQEATSSTEFEGAAGPNRYVAATDTDNPNIVHVAGTNETLNLKPVMVDQKTLEPPFQKLMRKVKQEPFVPICTCAFLLPRTSWPPACARACVVDVCILI